MIRSGKEIVLKDLIDEVKEGFSPNDNEDIPYIGLEHIEKQLLTFKAIGKSSEAESNKRRFTSKDILLGTLRPYFRKVVKPSFDGICSTDIAVLRPKNEKEKNFLFYLIASQPFIDYASVTANGTKMPRAKWKVLAKTKWVLPDLEERIKIGNILANYDILIKNNTKRIAILEEIAEQTYKEWFVRMRFPNYQNTNFTKGIPEGWKVDKLGNVIETTKGYAFKSDWFKETGDVAVVKVSDFTIDSIDSSNLAYLTEEYREIYKKHKLNTGAVVIQTVGSWPSNPESVVGKVIKVPSFVNGALLNQNAVIVNSNTLSDNYLYHTLKYNSFKEYIEGCAQGAASQASITLDSIRKFNLLIPKEELLIKFDDFVNPINNEINNLIIQNQNLQKTRDLLLPRLISGKLKIQTEDKKQVEAQKQITVFYQKQILAHIIKKQEEHKMPQGEMVLAKNTYLIDKIYGINTGFQWKNWHYGTYDGNIRKLINGRDRFFAKKEVGSSGYKVLVLGENKDKIMDAKYHHSTLDKVDSAMDELLAIYSKYSKDERSHKIELLNTTCKAIADTQNLDYKAIREAFENWKTPKAKFDTKAQKFNTTEIKKCMKFIISKEWHKKLITS
ncbi:restriction endonuclease subunit S [uncultured Psychroserpens sp.]|uniref:restriction endonuclease subunit S n=1 Tax=uncultured Psychroserpens sp. TaxID=255436 RepID=UPI0026227CB0|nr:restriction endonuclease subunit S [uncultured Psychroserpens sp.]